MNVPAVDELSSGFDEQVVVDGARFGGVLQPPGEDDAWCHDVGADEVDGRLGEWAVAASVARIARSTPMLDDSKSDGVHKMTPGELVDESADVVAADEQAGQELVAEAADLVGS